MSDQAGSPRWPVSSRRRGLRARFDAPQGPSGDGGRPVESCRIRIERDPGRAGGPYAERGGRCPDGGRTEEGTKAGKVWDPWAEGEPVLGDRETRHALSRHPGTPPCGNLAVEPPPGEGEPAPQEPYALVALDRALRVELELGASGRWTFGLVERASRVGFEARLGGRSVGARDFVVAGRRVKVLVSPHDEPAFVLPARVLWVDPPAGPDGPLRAQLALATSDATVLARWIEAVRRARG